MKIAINRIEVAKYKRRINTLELEKKDLEEIIKDGLFKEFIKKINEPLELERLRKENKKLRKKIKDLKKEVE
jgi:cell division protein FtsB